MSPPLNQTASPCGFIPPHGLTHTPPDTPLLVGLSGGPDSSLLLSLCASLPEVREGVCRLYAAHLHHGIRGEEADRDLACCRALAASLDVTLIEGRADVPSLAASRGESLETAARTARYSFFASALDQIAASRPDGKRPLLLTAHHADDQLETLLLRFLRGTGTRGMGGIPPVRPFAGTLLARPLLGVTRAEILTACEARGLHPVTDSTNDTDDCTRNRLRHTLIPLLRELAGEDVPARAALRLADASRADDEALTAIAEEAYARLASPDGLPLDGLCGLPEAILRRVLLRAYADAASGAPEESSDTAYEVSAGRSLSAAHLAALVRLIRSGVPHARTDLPGGMTAYCLPCPDRVTRLIFRAPDDGDASGEGLRPVTLTVGDNAWRDLTLTLEVIPAPAAPCEGERVLSSVVLPAALLDAGLILRSKTPGDVILCRGSHRKVKKLLCDAHLPEGLRARLPLLCRPSGEILWIPCLRLGRSPAVADGCPAPREGRALRLTLKERSL